MRALLVATCAVSLSTAALAQAPSASDPADRISQAQLAFDSGDFARAAETALELAQSPADLSPDDRAEAWRIAGLALFYAEDEEGSQHAFREYLRLKPRALLDPDIYAPEVRAVFDAAQAEVADEITTTEEPVESPGSLTLSFVPIAGQFQNDEPTKGWIILGATGALLATNLGTYLVLRDWCEGDSTCGDRFNRARTVKAVNLSSGFLAIGVLVYAVFDGHYGYRRREREMAPGGVMHVGARPGGAEVGWTWHF